MSEQLDYDIDQPLTDEQAESLLQQLRQLGDCGLRRTIQLLTENE